MTPTQHKFIKFNFLEWNFIFFMSHNVIQFASKKIVSIRICCLPKIFRLIEMRSNEIKWSILWVIEHHYCYTFLCVSFYLSMDYTVCWIFHDSNFILISILNFCGLWKRIGRLYTNGHNIKTLMHFIWTYYPAGILC